MRYSIHFDRVINQLIPHYIGGRKLILYLQALMKPLQTLNDIFVEYAKETRIEAAMTSQVGYFEWYLNRKFSQYFKNPDDRISIVNGGHTGVPIYWESADVADSENMALYEQADGRQGTVLYLTNDKVTAIAYSFVVHTPAIDPDKITKAEYLGMLTHVIERYRIANKTYYINYDA